MRFEEQHIRFKGDTEVEGLFSYDPDEGLFMHVPKPSKALPLWFKKEHIGGNWDEILKDHVKFEKVDSKENKKSGEVWEINFDFMKHKKVRVSPNEELLVDSKILESERDGYWRQAVTRGDMVKNLNMIESIEAMQRKTGEHIKKLSPFNASQKGKK
jgi:hypothetical protein